MCSPVQLIACTDWTKLNVRRPSMHLLVVTTSVTGSMLVMSFYFYFRSGCCLCSGPSISTHGAGLSSAVRTATAVIDVSTCMGGAPVRHCPSAPATTGPARHVRVAASNRRRHPCNGAPKICPSTTQQCSMKEGDSCQSKKKTQCRSCT